MADGHDSHGPVRRVDKPWGFEIWFAVTDRYAGKILHIDAGEELSLQYHERKDESIIVLSGELELELGEVEAELTAHRLGPGDCQRIVPHLIHRMRAVSTVELCEVSTPDLEDVVRLKDRYGRAKSDSGSAPG
ncbi:MAG TPA: cupin domain-containing protein [Candidatus Dormibacteraeota bacterium]|nr:cupin domain-containing protein [Candidatus Dormibacteraeota bacterium]